jgi:alpha-tubulin suppressor-like RCC1 family protein
MMKIPVRKYVFASSGLILLLFLGMVVLSCVSLPGGGHRPAYSKWVFIAAGKGHSLAVRSDGTLWAWGGNGVGQLGDGTIKTRPVPVQVGKDNKWISTEAGYFHTVALQSDGSLWTWGLNEYGQLGDGTTDERHSPIQISLH